MSNNPAPADQPDLWQQVTEEVLRFTPPSLRQAARATVAVVKPLVERARFTDAEIHRQQIETLTNRLADEREDATQWFREHDKEMKRADAAESALSADRAERETLRAENIAELRRIAAWIRTPGNVWQEDAVDECARVLENRAHDLAKSLTQMAPVHRADTEP